MRRKYAGLPNSVINLADVVFWIDGPGVARFEFTKFSDGAKYLVYNGDDYQLPRDFDPDIIFQRGGDIRLIKGHLKQAFTLCKKRGK